MNVGKHKKAGQIIEINCVNFSKTFLSFFLCGSTIRLNLYFCWLRYRYCYCYHYRYYFSIIIYLWI